MHVVTETDINTWDSHSIAAYHGAVPRGRTVQWMLRTDRAR